MRKLTFSVTLVLLLMAVGAQADVTVTNLSYPTWHLISGNTFALPADLSSIGCGTENETTCEPTGIFRFNVGFATGTGNYNMIDHDTATGQPAISDIISVFNGTDGLGYVNFFSDPNLPAGIDPGTFLCDENIGNGCIGTITVLGTDGSVITINVASDSEAVFDPFGFGADTSDQIQVLGATPVEGVPEPATLALLGSGLFGLAGTIRRKFLG